MVYLRWGLGHAWVAVELLLLSMAWQPGTMALRQTSSSNGSFQLQVSGWMQSQCHAALSLGAQGWAGLHALLAMQCGGQ
jgi:hypothetical protein